MERPNDGGASASSKPRRRRRRGGKKPQGDAPADTEQQNNNAPSSSQADRSSQQAGGQQQSSGQQQESGQRKKRRRRGGRRRRKSHEGEQGAEGRDGQPRQQAQQVKSGKQKHKRDGQSGQSEQSEQSAQPKQSGEGMFVAEKGDYGTLRSRENSYAPSKQDIFVPQRLIQKHMLRDGSIVTGSVSRGKKHKFQLNDVETIDGRDPQELRNLADFKSLTSIDPDFHYALGDATGDVTMRVLDIIAPVGRGQRALIVAPPRTGKTTIMRELAKGIEETYPDVHLIILLIDERPEEATDWKRSVKGDVFVSTSDDLPKRHVQLAEAVWKRCQRLVELGEEVVLLLDSITRLARAYNNHSGGSGRTMSGGLDSRAMERPRQIFGSARNTETAGSLTIVGTTLVDTGSRMDQLIFEEFKGTGNAEIVLNRKLADRRIFPAIDIERSGTRKEEKLFGRVKLRRVNTLRRVLLKMNFMEAMELLITKLEEVEKTDDFLQRFDVDPEA